MVNILILVFFIIWVPESPKWLHTWKRFAETREALQKVGDFNGLSEQTIKEDVDPEGVIEAKFLSEKYNGDMDDAKTIKTHISVEVTDISDSKFYLNVAIISIAMTATCVSFAILNFMNKYLEGSIYLNFYLEGLAGIIGVFVGQPIYDCLKIRLSLILSYIIVIILAVFLLCFQGYYIPSDWTTSIG